MSRGVKYEGMERSKAKGCNAFQQKEVNIWVCLFFGKTKTVFPFIAIYRTLCSRVQFSVPSRNFWRDSFLPAQPYASLTSGASVSLNRCVQGANLSPSLTFVSVFFFVCHRNDPTKIAPPGSWPVEARREARVRSCRCSREKFSREGMR